MKTVIVVLAALILASLFLVYPVSAQTLTPIHTFSTEWDSVLAFSEDGDGAVYVACGDDGVKLLLGSSSMNRYGIDEYSSYETEITARYIVHDQYRYLFISDGSNEIEIVYAYMISDYELTHLRMLYLPEDYEVTGLHLVNYHDILVVYRDGDNDGVLWYNVDDIDNPQVILNYPIASVVHDAFIRYDKLIIGSEDYGFQVYDIEDISNPVLEFEDNEYPCHAVGHSTLAYSAAYPDGLCRMYGTHGTSLYNIIWEQQFSEEILNLPVRRSGYTMTWIRTYNHIYVVQCDFINQIEIVDSEWIGPPAHHTTYSGWMSKEIVYSIYNNVPTMLFVDIGFSSVDIVDGFHGLDDIISVKIDGLNCAVLDKYDGLTVYRTERKEGFPPFPFHVGASIWIEDWEWDAMDIRGEWIATAANRDVQLFNIADPEEPILVGEHGTPAKDVKLGDGYIATVTQQYIRMLDMTVPYQLYEPGVGATIYNSKFDLNNDRIVAAGYHDNHSPWLKIRVYDVLLEDGTPRLSSTSLYAETCEDIVYNGDYASLLLTWASGEQTIDIYDINEDGSVALTGQYAFSDVTESRTLHQEGDLLWTQENGDLIVLDVSDPDNITSVTTYSMPHAVATAFSADGHALVTDGRNLEWIDASSLGVSERFISYQTLPHDYRIISIAPNPFNASTTATISLPGPSDVTLALYNMIGQQVSVLHQGQLLAGQHRMNVDASRLASGMYLLRMDSGERMDTRRLTIIK